MTRKVSSPAELRQRVLEMLARGEDPAGTVWEVPAGFLDMSQPIYPCGIYEYRPPEIELPSGKKAVLNGNEIIVPE